MDKFEAVRLYGLALNFWQLTLNVAGELIRTGNPCSMFYEGWHWPSDEEYEEHTKWSDINIIEPTLFNFYHGIELSLKALIFAKTEELNNNHKLSELLSVVRDLYCDQGVVQFYDKYIESDKIPFILKNFCKKSGMSMDLYFQSLKYPTSTKGVEFNHNSLRAHGLDGVELFKEISVDLKSARSRIEKHIVTECRDVLE